MNTYLKILLVIVAVYIVIGLVIATRWAITYDPKINSFPNNPVAFILNTLFWVNRL
jgi:hypothetical protein